MSEIDFSAANLLEMLKSLIADELKTLRCDPHIADHAAHWDERTSITAAVDNAQASTLDADSLERLVLAMRVADVFHIRDSGLQDYLLRFKTLGEWVELIQHTRTIGHRHLTFFTSGSSDQPKACAHCWETLLAEVQHCGQLFAATLGQPIQRIIALVPAHHIYGCLFSVILADWLQVPVIRNQAALIHCQARTLQAGDLILGFPFLWKQLARQAQPFPQHVLGVTSTSPCEPQIIRQLKHQGLRAMVELYGASETAGIGVRTDPEQPFALLPRWQRAEGDALLECASGERYPLNDALSWHDDRQFIPGGRLDQAVQVGGVNVFPQRIAAQLAALPEVEAARVRLMRPDEGDRLKAFIVPADSVNHSQQLIDQLQHWCNQHLTAPERPRAFTIGAQLPSNAMGKDSDWRLDVTPS